MKVSAPHGTTKQGARETIVEEMPKLLQRFGGQVSNARYSWRGDRLEFSFRAFGADLKGAVHVKESDVEVEVGIPFRFRLFQGRIEDEVREWCDRVFRQSESSS